jgi:putative hemolysin
MKKSVLISIIVLVVFVLAILVILSIPNKTIIHDLQSNTTIANPASVYCIQNGGNFSIVEDKGGNQQGMCTLSDGTLCDEWAYFRGECGNSSANECNTDDDCVPSSCCHPTSCISKQNTPVCEGRICTMNCAPGTLDCGQGSCKCTNNKCGAVLN